MTTATDAKPRRRWVWPVLILSLAVNLVVLGLIASFYWKHSHGHGGQRLGKYERLATVIEQFIPELPQAGQEAAKSQLARSREETVLLGEKIQELRKQIRDLITAPEFDEPRMRETLDLLRSARTEQGRSMSEAALLVVSGLSKDQRTRFLETVRSRKHWRQGGPDKDK